MFSFFKKKEIKPYHRFEIRQDGNGEFMVQVNSRGDDFADMSAHMQLKGRRFANVFQAEKAIDTLLKDEERFVKKYQTTFVKTYP
jgi:hypothetical protein